MDTVFEALFFLAVGFIAITITVYVLAVSLLGRAIKMSIQEQSAVEEKKKIDRQEEINKLKEQLTGVNPTKDIDIVKLRKVLEHNLKHLESMQKRHQRTENWIKTKPKLLSADGGVLLPGVLFLISIIISIAARYVLVKDPDANVIGFLIGSIGLMLVGLSVVYQSLKVIESVALTSEDTAFVRESDALKKALKDFEEERKPTLTFNFVDDQTPFHLKADTEVSLKFTIGLKNYDVARVVRAHIWLPPTFSIKNNLPGAMLEKHLDYISARFELGDMTKSFSKSCILSLKTPIEKQDYSAFYSCDCEGFSGIVQEFHIVIV